MQATQPRLQIGMTIGYDSPTTQDYHGKAMLYRSVMLVTDVTWKYATVYELASVRMHDHNYDYNGGEVGLREKPMYFNRDTALWDPGYQILD